MTKPMNVLFLFSDEHRRDAAGCYGHSLVQTPNLDKLAQRGTRFDCAYTTSPVCVPARASMATGQYVHKTRCWSNAQAYDGTPNSFGHRLQQQDIPVSSIGKLHYRGKEFDNGFDEELLPLYIKDGKGWIKGLLRNHEAVLDCSSYAAEIGPGNDQYTDYDIGVTREACRWIKDHSNNASDQNWVLFVSWLRPHYPLTCPQEYYELYPLDEMDHARFRSREAHSAHPVTKQLRESFDYDRYFTEETRQIARASYYGLCSFLDAQLGVVLDALESSGQVDNTLIIYTSDHGDHNGDRGMWTKMTLYDESAAIPMIIAGPGICEGHSCQTPTSLVDIYPTILQATGVEDTNEDKPGIPLQRLAESSTQERSVLSEYHDGGSPTGMFMLRTKDWKYNVYPGYEPELFDMKNDPDELNNVAGQEAYQEAEQICAVELSQIVDAERENTIAFADQAKVIEQLGGVDAILRSQEFDFTPVSSA